MDLFDEKFSLNTLSSLQFLGGKLLSDTQRQVSLVLKQKEIEALSSAVEQLSQKRICLQRSLVHSSKDDGIALDFKHGKIVHEAAICEKAKLASYLVSAQRLTGVTAAISEQNKLKIQYETCYKGEYFEPYYLVLNFENSYCKVFWHTLPDFVPLSDLVEKYNVGETQFQLMIHLIHSYLTAFVKRRQQAVEFSNRYPEYLKQDIAASHTYNTIQLVLEIPMNREESFHLIVQLYYKDLLSIFPSAVKCSDTACLPASKARIKEAFMTLPIAGAFQNLFLDQNIEQG